MAVKIKTKDRILEVALKLFEKKGFHATTFQQIAEEVGISQPGIFIHFKNKMELFGALRRQVANNNREFVDSQITIHDSAIASLQKHCQRNLEWVVKYPDQSQLIILLYHYSCFDLEMKELNQAALAAGQERILKYILAGVREGTIQTDAPERLAQEIHTHIIGQSIVYLALKKSPSPKAIHENIEAFLKRILVNSEG